MVYRTAPVELGANPLANDDQYLNNPGLIEFGGSPAGLDLSMAPRAPLGMQTPSFDEASDPGIGAIMRTANVPQAQPQPAQEQARIFYSPSTGDMVVNGYQFNERNASNALESETWARQPTRQFQLPDTADDWTEMSNEEYSSYLDSIRNPGVGRRATEAWEHAWRGFGDVNLGAALAVNPDWDWAQTARENLAREFHENAPFMVGLRDIENPGDASIFAMQMGIQAVPWIVETVASMVVGGIAGGIVSGGVGAPAGAVEGLIVREGLRRATTSVISGRLRAGAAAYSRILADTGASQLTRQQALRSAAASEVDDLGRFFDFSERLYHFSRGSADDALMSSWGARFGAGATNYAAAVGDIRNSIADAGGDPTTATSVANIWGGAIPYALLESFGDIIWTAPLTRTFPEFFDNAAGLAGRATRAGVVGVSEGIQEVAQTYVTEQATANATDTPLDIDPIDLLEAGLGGFFGGAAVGGVMGGRTNPAEDQDTALDATPAGIPQPIIPQPDFEGTTDLEYPGMPGMDEPLMPSVPEPIRPVPVPPVRDLQPTTEIEYPGMPGMDEPLAPPVQQEPVSTPPAPYVPPVGPETDLPTVTGTEHQRLIQRGAEGAAIKALAKYNPKLDRVFNQILLSVNKGLFINAELIREIDTIPQLVVPWVEDQDQNPRGTFPQEHATMALMVHQQMKALVIDHNDQVFKETIELFGDVSNMSEWSEARLDRFRMLGMSVLHNGKTALKKTQRENLKLAIDAAEARLRSMVRVAPATSERAQNMRKGKTTEEKAEERRLDRVRRREEQDAERDEAAPEGFRRNPLRDRKYRAEEETNRSLTDADRERMAREAQEALARSEQEAATGSNTGSPQRPAGMSDADAERLGYVSQSPNKVEPKETIDVENDYSVDIIQPFTKEDYAAVDEFFGEGHAKDILDNPDAQTLYDDGVEMHENGETVQQQTTAIKMVSMSASMGYEAAAVRLGLKPETKVALTEEARKRADKLLLEDPRGGNMDEYTAEERMLMEARMNEKYGDDRNEPTKYGKFDPPPEDIAAWVKSVMALDPEDILERINELVREQNRLAKRSADVIGFAEASKRIKDAQAKTEEPTPNRLKNAARRAGDALRAKPQPKAEPKPDPVLKSTLNENRIETAYKKLVELSKDALKDPAQRVRAYLLTLSKNQNPSKETRKWAEVNGKLLTVEEARAIEAMFEPREQKKKATPRKTGGLSKEERQARRFLLDLDAEFSNSRNKDPSVGSPELFELWVREHAAAAQAWYDSDESAKHPARPAVLKALKGKPLAMAVNHGRLHRHKKMWEFIQRVELRTPSSMNKIKTPYFPIAWKQEVLAMSDGMFRTLMDVAGTFNGLVESDNEVGRAARAYEPLAPWLSEKAKAMKADDARRAKLESNVGLLPLEDNVVPFKRPTKNVKDDGVKGPGITLELGKKVVKHIQRVIAPRARARTVHVFRNAKEMIANRHNHVMIASNGAEVTMDRWLLGVTEQMKLEHRELKDMSYENLLVMVQEGHLDFKAAIINGFNALVVFTDQMKSERHLVSVLEHEFIVHVGLRAIFPNDADREAFLGRVFLLPGMEERVLALVQQYPGYRNYTIFEQVEEVLAFHAMEGPLALEMLLSTKVGVDPKTRETLWQTLVRLWRQWVTGLYQDTTPSATDMALDILVAGLREHAITGSTVGFNDALTIFAQFPMDAALVDRLKAGVQNSDIIKAKTPRGEMPKIEMVSFTESQLDALQGSLKDVRKYITHIQESAVRPINNDTINMGAGSVAEKLSRNRVETAIERLARIASAIEQIEQSANRLKTDDAGRSDLLTEAAELAEQDAESAKELADAFVLPGYIIEQLAQLEAAWKTKREEVLTLKTQLETFLAAHESDGKIIMAANEATPLTQEEYNRMLYGEDEYAGRAYTPSSYVSKIKNVMESNLPTVEKLHELARKAGATNMKEKLRAIGRNIETMNNMGERSVLVKKLMDMMHRTIHAAREQIESVNETRIYARKSKQADNLNGSTQAERDGYNTMARIATNALMPKISEQQIQANLGLITKDVTGARVVNDEFAKKLIDKSIVAKQTFKDGMEEFTVTPDGELVPQGKHKLPAEMVDASYDKIYVPETKHMAWSAVNELKHALIMLNEMHDVVVQDLMRQIKVNTQDEAFFQESLKRINELYADIAFHQADKSSVDKINSQLNKARQVMIELMRAYHVDDKVKDWTESSRVEKDGDPRQESAFKWRQITGPDVHEDVKPFVAQIGWFLENDPATGKPRIARMGELGVTEGQQYDMLNAFQNIITTEMDVRQRERQTIQSIMGNYVEFTRRGKWRVYVEVLNASDGKRADISADFITSLIITYPENENDANVLQQQLQGTLDGTYKVKNVDGNLIDIKFNVKSGRAPGTQTLAEAPNVKQFLDVARVINLKFTAPQMKEIANLIENAGGRRRFGLKRSGIPGMDANILKSNSEVMTRRAWTGAKMSRSWALNRLFDDRKNLYGDMEHLEKLQREFDIANRGAPEGQPVPVNFVRNEAAVYFAEKQLLMYANQMKHMMEKSQHQTHVVVRTTTGTKKLKIEPEAQEHLNHATALRESIKRGDLELNLNDILSKTGPLRMSVVAMQLGSVGSAIMQAFSLFTHLPVLLTAAHHRTSYGEGYATSEVMSGLMTAVVHASKNLAVNDTAAVHKLLEEVKAGKSIGIDQHELAFIYQEILTGVLAPQQTYSMTGGTESNISKLWLRNLAEVAMMPFAKVEAWVRRAAALLIYRLAKARYIRAGVSEAELNDPTSQAYAKLTEDVRRPIFQSQGDYSNINRAKILRGDMGQYFGLYKMFPIMTQIMVYNLPLQNQLAFLTIMFLLGGLKGEPFADDFMDIYDTLLQKLGFQHDSVELQLIQALEDVMPGSSKYVMNGFVDSAAFGGTMSTRISMGDIIPGTGLFRDDADLHRELTGLFGPAYAGNVAMLEWAWLATDFTLQTLGIKNQTNNWEDLVRTMPQAQLRGLGEAVLMARDGSISDARGRLVSDEVTPWSIFARALAFYPLEATRANTAVRLDRMHLGYMRAVRARYVLAYANAYRAEDQERMDRIADDVRRWNEAAEQTGQEDMVISNFRAAGIRAGRAARQTTVERASESAPDYSVIDEVAAALNADEESEED